MNNFIGKVLLTTKSERLMLSKTKDYLYRIYLMSNPNITPKVRDAIKKENRGMPIIFEIPDFDSSAWVVRHEVDKAKENK